MYYCCCLLLALTVLKSGVFFFLHFSLPDGPGNSIRLSPNITTLVTSHGSTFPVIECIADCNPPCSYFWTRMGSGANLTLGTVNRWHHTGEHTCQASNRVGSTRYETNITFVMYVKCKLKFI